MYGRSHTRRPALISHCHWKPFPQHSISFCSSFLYTVFVTLQSYTVYWERLAKNEAKRKAIAGRLEINNLPMFRSFQRQKTFMNASFRSIRFKRVVSFSPYLQHLPVRPLIINMSKSRNSIQTFVAVTRSY